MNKKGIEFDKENVLNLLKDIKELKDAIAKVGIKIAAAECMVYKMEELLKKVSSAKKNK
jgi:hypothetical protein